MFKDQLQKQQLQKIKIKIKKNVILESESELLEKLVGTMDLITIQQ